MMFLVLWADLWLVLMGAGWWVQPEVWIVWSYNIYGECMRSEI